MRRTLLCTLAAAALLTGCGKPRQTARMLTVQTAAISEASFSPNIQAISVLESTTNVVLMPETDGRVVQVLARDGQQVKAGQPILVLDNAQESASLDAAQAQARTDTLNAERYEFLYRNGAVSAKERDQYATQAIASRDKARSAAANLGYKFVRAPIDGVIGDLDTVKLGDYVKAGQKISGIVNNSTLWTLMQIPATQAADVAIGQTVKVVSQGNPPVQGKGSVVFISPLFRDERKLQCSQHLDGESRIPESDREVENRSVRQKRHHHRTQAKSRGACASRDDAGATAIRLQVGSSEQGPAEDQGLRNCSCGDEEKT